MNPQSPARIFIPATWPRLSTALVLAISGSGYAGDLLRGGGYTAPAPRAASGNEAGSVQANQARTAAQDALARTTQVLTSVKTLQQSARDAAAQQNSARPDLPTVSNGLGNGGLKVAAGAATGSALWSGANLPVQTTNTAAARFTEKVTIKQTSQQAVLTWDTFNVGLKTELVFDQSAGGASRSQWIAFNTVNDPSGVPSQILGSIKADGQVYVINQNGIIFGGASQVNTHALVASALPLNQNLVDRGLLNNPDSQFLFSALPQPAGKNTPAMTPATGYAPNGRIGDVVVQAGAQLVSPTSADKVGGRIALIGPNVTNAGSIETPDGQTILAAGLQAGFVAHDTNDPTLRGLDVYVGAVTDPASIIPAYAGTAVNSGLISAMRANVTVTGKNVRNEGAIDSSTSVSLNGRIDLNASYDAISTNGIDQAPPFLYQNNSTGTVSLGAGSMMRILPELASTEKVVGTKLALNSKVNITGLAVHMEENSTLLAPSADVVMNAGVWAYLPSPTSPQSDFLQRNGQIYLDSGAILSVAGTAGVNVAASQNFVTAELRAAELADSPLLRDSALRGQSVVVDIRNTGTYNGRTWVGSPIADVSGYANLIQRTVGELTVAGGTVKMNAGDSFVMQSGATVDVSNGWINYTGASVQTTRLLSNGHVVDIAQATPDRVYDGVFKNKATSGHDQWNLPESFPGAIGPNGEHTDPGGLFGGSGGSLSITAPGMVLDGHLTGTTVTGPGQRSQLPKLSELTLNFQRREAIAPQYYPESPTPPAITFSETGSLPAAGAFTLDANGKPLPLDAARLAQVILSPSLLAGAGFGSLTVNNGLGDITVPANVTLTAPAQGTIALSAANVTIEGSLSAPGGTINLTAYAASPFEAAKANADKSLGKPAAIAGHGSVKLASTASINTAGLLVDDRLVPDGTATGPLTVNGGSISINGYNTLLSEGSILNASGGASAGTAGKITYGTGGSITVKGGVDPNVPEILGGHLTLGSTLSAMSGGRGGSLSVTAPAIQVGGTTTNPDVLLLQASFFNQGGFTNYALTGYGLATGTAGQFTPGINVAAGTQINPTAQSWLADTWVRGT
ncbi:MAG TPA: filamentous hemagglutinin N-terminal domain-containing protein, partial [Verrucomicrobiales bacterium]|nr:filamentous hemagglutinin N-terminal domain-containing protein [Verrucomicrobiales bacterium]